MANRKQVDTSRVLSILVCIIFMIFSAVFAYYIYSLQLFPQKYLVSGIVALFVINLIIVVLLLTRSRKWKQIVSGILLVISVVGFIFAFRTLGSVDRFIKDMSEFYGEYQAGEEVGGRAPLVSYTTEDLEPGEVFDRRGNNA